MFRDPLNDPDHPRRASRSRKSAAPPTSRPTTRSTSRATPSARSSSRRSASRRRRALSVPPILPALSGRDASSIDVITTPAIAAEQLQWAPHVTHVVDMPVGFGIGALVMNKKFYSELPDDIRTDHRDHRQEHERAPHHRDPQQGPGGVERADEDQEGRQAHRRREGRVAGEVHRACARSSRPRARSRATSGTPSRRPPASRGARFQRNHPPLLASTQVGPEAPSSRSAPSLPPPVGHVVLRTTMRAM